MEKNEWTTLGIFTLKNTRVLPRNLKQDNFGLLPYTKLRLSVFIPGFCRTIMIDYLEPAC